ncbi:MAG: GntR family transcriptional regulator [Stomatobaculum sp.]|nr:GntR family transcriptional regulator [Stomatobaculum sp.]
MILLDPRDHRPIYEQITDKLSELILLGVLPPDSPLPSVRSLASDLSINPNTVQRAYLELERKGFTYSVKGKGSFAADPHHARIQKQQLIRTELENIVRKAVSLSLPEEDLVEETRRLYAMYSEQLLPALRTAADGTGNMEDRKNTEGGAE